ncbi:MAG: DUF3606 domain-containing protein [Sulfurifustis sp.]
MADDLKIKQPQDPTKINVHESWEVNYWCKKFGITPDQLKAAVRAVGPSVNRVKEHLGIR